MFTHGQSDEVKKTLKDIEGQWSLDDNGNVSYQRIVEVPEMKKDDIYNRVYIYFVYNYDNIKSVIQIEDKENGLIVGKRLYKNILENTGLVKFYIDSWHIIRVDIKDGRARIILTLTDYNKKVGDNNPVYVTYKIRQDYPINEKGLFENDVGKAFYKSHQKTIASLDAIERAIKIGNTSKIFENNKW